MVRAPSRERRMGDHWYYQVLDRLADFLARAPGDLRFNDPRTGKPYFNIDLFSKEAIGQLGTASKRFFHGPGLNNWDMALLKDTHITESKVLQFRFEFF